MKRFLVCLFLLISVPCFGWESWQKTATCTVATDNTVTDNVALPQHLVGAVSYVYVPTLTSSTVTLKGSVDGTTYGVVGSYNNAGNMSDWTIAAGTGGKTYLLPDLRPFRYVQFVFGSQQAADRSLVIFGVK